MAHAVSGSLIKEGGHKFRKRSVSKFYCLRKGTSKRGEGQPLLRCRSWKTA